MQVSARVDYGIRALVELASRDDGHLVTAEELAALQGLPVKFLEGILTHLRRAGLIVSRRGAEGGYRLGRPAAAITVADVFRAIDGPIAAVRGQAPEDLEYPGAAEHLREVWVATRAALREVLEHVTLADVVSGELPDATRSLLAQPGAWERR
jgi:Rrf2 family protein